MTLRVISLGAGVQSTTMALMAAHGEIGPMPDCAIFADTGWEPRAVYDHLAWLMSPNVLPYPVHVVSAGSLREKVLRAGYSDVPWHTPTGMGRRQCTKVFKLYPLWRKSRDLLALPPNKRPRAGSVEMWIGISTDEASRAKPCARQYINNRWPLIEAGMNRNDCLRWLEGNGYPRPPRSACLACPFLNDADWRARKAGPADEWGQTVADDRAIRTLGAGGVQQFAHRSLKPLDQVDFRTDEDRGQLNMFNNECEGMCGV